MIVSRSRRTKKCREESLEFFTIYFLGAYVDYRDERVYDAVIWKSVAHDSYPFNWEYLLVLPVEICLFSPGGFKESSHVASLGYSLSLSSNSLTL